MLNNTNDYLCPDCGEKMEEVNRDYIKYECTNCGTLITDNMVVLN